MGTRLPQALSLQRHNPKSPGRAPHPEHHRLRADGTFCPRRQLSGDSNQGSLLTRSTRYGAREQAKATFFFLSLTNMNKKHLVKDLPTAENASFTQLR